MNEQQQRSDIISVARNSGIPRSSSNGKQTASEVVLDGLAANEHEPYQWSPRTPRGFHLATYCDFVEEDATPIMRIARFEKPDPDAKKGRKKIFWPFLALSGGGFATEPGSGTLHPLYHLDERASALAAGADAYLVEGPQKTDVVRAVLRARGDLAWVTTLGSSANGLTGDDLAKFAGFERVSVLADSDDSGRKSAKANADLIAAAFPEAVVRVAEFYPEADGKGHPDWAKDVEDFFNDGGTLDAFRANVEQAKRVAERPPKSEVSGTESDDAGWVLQSAADVSDEVAPIEWDIEGILTSEGGPLLIYGMPESLKSWIAGHLSRCMLTGEPAFGHFAVTNSRPEAIFLNFDAPGGSFTRRVTLIKNGAPPEIASLLFASPEMFDGEKLLEILNTHPGAFVTLDCFADIYAPDSKAEPGQAMRAFVRWLRKSYELRNCNGVVVDHARRPKPGDPATAERYYGSGQKKAAFRQIWFVDRLRQPGDDPSVVRAKIVCEKQGDAERFAPFLIEARWSPKSVVLTYVGPLSEQTPKVDAAMRHRDIIEPYLADNPMGLTAAQIAQKTNLSRKQVLAATKTPGISAIGKGVATRYFLCETVMDAADGDEDAQESLHHDNPLGAGNDVTTRHPEDLLSKSLPRHGNDDGHASENLS